MGYWPKYYKEQEKGKGRSEKEGITEERLIDYETQRYVTLLETQFN